ncbi:MAG TPA: hypothetical protein VIQ30_22225 [Pseudonocardia sp.]
MAGPRTKRGPRPQANAGLSTEAILAAINDGAGDQDLVGALNAALYRFGAQDPSKELPLSWQRVQRRIGVDADKLDGVATAEQVAAFADRSGLAVSR